MDAELGGHKPGAAGTLLSGENMIGNEVSIADGRAERWKGPVFEPLDLTTPESTRLPGT